MLPCFLFKGGSGRFFCATTGIPLQDAHSEDTLALAGIIWSHMFPTIIAKENTKGLNSSADHLTHN